jgi:hypothetical protein
VSLPLSLLLSLPLFIVAVGAIVNACSMLAVISTVPAVCLLPLLFLLTPLWF